MLVRRTIVDQIEIRRDGTIQVRLATQIVEREEVLRSEYHRLALEPGADVEAALPAVDAHLQAMGEAPPTAGEWERVRRIVAAEYRPEVVRSFSDRVRAARARGFSDSRGRG